MIAKTLVLVCAAFGLAAGSCFDFQIPQQSCQTVSIPVSVGSSCSSPCENVFSTGCSNAVVVPTTSFADNCFSGNVFSSVDASSAGFPSGFVSGYAGVQATNGPEGTQVQVFDAPAVTLPAVEGPTVSLSSPAIPAPRVIAQRCICTKTIVRPQVIQRTVTVPKIQRYLKRTVTPVVENVAYKSTPIAQPESSGYASSSGVSGASFGFSSGNCGDFSGNTVSLPVVSSQSCGVSVPVYSQSNCASVPVVSSSCSSSCPRYC